MDFDYWDRLGSPRTCFTVYATDHQQSHQRAIGPGHRPAGGNQRVLLDDQEELDSIRALVKSNGGRKGREELNECRPGNNERATKLIRMSSSNNHQIGRRPHHHHHPPPPPSSASAYSSASSHSPFSSSPSYHIRNASASPASSALSPPPPRSHHHHHLSSSVLQSSSTSGEAICAVCGDGHAKLHYGVLACYGCKGFFRRTLTGKYRYVCRFGSNCIVDKFQRNSCRCCRFQRCIDVGMDPKAVRPDRDLTGKQKVTRVRKRAMDEELINHMMRLQGDDWSRKIPVEAKMLLMQLLNIESKVAKGDSTLGDNLPPPPVESTVFGSGTMAQNAVVSLKDLFEQKPSSTRRTEMCYEPYRMARAEELPKIAHRGAIAAVDWVESLDELIESVVLDTSDKISLVKACYAPLTIFNFSARTVQNTRNPDILCLCSYSYVPRKLPSDFNGSNHLSNNLIDRTLNELVAPLRKLALREEEVVALKAIIILDPNAKNLSAEAQQGVVELRDRMQDMLFQIVKELHPAQNAASRFGNLLLLLPTITTLSSLMCENMQFCQVFGWTDPLLNELFEPIEGDKADQFAFFSETSSGIMPLSYSPPMLGGESASSAQFNPADISLHPNEEQASPSSSLPRNLTSSRLSTSCSSTSSPSSSSSSSPSPSKPHHHHTLPEKCEISTQTDGGGAEFDQQHAIMAAHSMAPSYEFEEQRGELYGQQDLADFSAQSPYHAFFDVQSHHDGDRTDVGDPMEFSAVDSFLFGDNNSTTSAADLFGLMQ